MVKHGLNKYGDTLIELPVPKLLVFYNGEEEMEDERILRLSDSFPEEKREDSDIAVRVRMLNINAGKNRKLMEECRPLYEYAWLVACIRKYEKEEKETREEPADMAEEERKEYRKEQRKQELERAIDRAVDEIPEDFILRPFIMEHRAEGARCPVDICFARTGMEWRRRECF